MKVFVSLDYGMFEVHNLKGGITKDGRVVYVENVRFERYDIRGIWNPMNALDFEFGFDEGRCTLKNCSI